MHKKDYMEPLMKKQHLRYAGIVSAATLVILFAGILLTGSFTIFPTAAIDPVSDHAAGDLMAVTGTTNLPVETRLVLVLVPAVPVPGTTSVAESSEVTIVRGGGMTNTWSGALDTSAIIPGEYLVNVYRVNETASKKPLATARFRLTDAVPQSVRFKHVNSNHPVVFIRIDPPITIYRGEKILISGITNLPEGTGLLYVITQQSQTSVFTVDSKTKEQDLKGGYTQSGLIALQPGLGGVSPWSFALDSTGFIPDEYEVIVTPDTVSPGMIGQVDPYDTASLVVLETTLDRLTTLKPDTGPCQSITIDAFLDPLAGRTYTISGTTTLPPETPLLFTILPREYDFAMNPGSQGMSGTISGATGTTEVTRGSGDLNTWSVETDLSLLPPGDYRMNVSNDRIDRQTYATISGDRYCIKTFNLTG
jgi:hypothetical protein